MEVVPDVRGEETEDRHVELVHARESEEDHEREERFARGQPPAQAIDHVAAPSVVRALRGLGLVFPLPPLPPLPSATAALAVSKAPSSIFSSTRRSATRLGTCTPRRAATLRRRLSRSW